MKKQLYSIGLIIGAGLAALLIYSAWLLLIAFLADYFKSHGANEAYLFTDSLLKPIALTFIGFWLVLSGIFLKRQEITKGGRILLYIYLAVSVVPYFLSFGAKPV